MINYKKFLISISIFLFGFKSIFAGAVSDTFNEAFGSFNDFLVSENVLYFLFFLGIFFSIFKISEFTLSKLFKSEEGASSKKMVNTIAATFSIISSGGFFYAIGGESKAYLLTLYGGVSFLFIIIIASIILFRFFLELAKSEEDNTSYNKFKRFSIFFIGLFLSLKIIQVYLSFLKEKVAGELPSWLIGFIDILESFFSFSYILMVLSIIIFVGIVFKNQFKGFRGSSDTDEHTKSVSNIKSLIKRVLTQRDLANSDLKEMGKNIKSLNNNLGGNN